MTITEQLSIIDSIIKETFDGNQEIDKQIAEVLGHKIIPITTQYTMELKYAIHWQKPHPYAGMKEPCPNFSTSLDAVKLLIPKNWNITIRQVAFGWQASANNPSKELYNQYAEAKTEVITRLLLAINIWKEELRVEGNFHKAYRGGISSK